MPADHARSVVAHYDERARSYDESAMHRGLTDVVADLPELRAATAVLDVATGTGLLLRALAARRSGQRLVGIDLSAGMLEVARRELADATFTLADAGAVPLPDASVDVIACVTALHLFDRPDAVLREWARVIVAGGHVVTATFAPADKYDGPHRGGFVRRHEAYRTPELVAGALAPYGFRPVRHTRWSHDDDQLLVCVLAAP